MAINIEVKHLMKKINEIMINRAVRYLMKKTKCWRWLLLVLEVHKGKYGGAEAELGSTGVVKEEILEYFDEIC